MNDFFAGFKNVQAYIDDLLVLTKSSFEDHLVKLKSVLKKLKGAGININSNKSFFTHEELEYIGYWITREGILSIKKNRSTFENCTPNIPQKTLQFHWVSQLLPWYVETEVRNLCATHGNHVRKKENGRGWTSIKKHLNKLKKF